MEEPVGDVAFGVVDHLRPRRVQLGFAAVAGEAAGTGGVDEEPVDVGEGVVAGGAVDWPCGGKLFVAFEDLFDDQIVGVGRSRSLSR